MKKSLKLKMASVQSVTASNDTSDLQLTMIIRPDKFGGSFVNSVIEASGDFSTANFD